MPGLLNKDVMQTDHNFQQDPSGTDVASIYSHFFPPDFCRHDDNVCVMSPYSLVNTLANCQDFSSSLQDLSKYNFMTPSCIPVIAAEHPNLFSLQKELVKLTPRIDICKSHCGPTGCPNGISCYDLHICSNYVMEKCHYADCAFGHRWNTSHNQHLLNKLYLDVLPSKTLEKLIKANTIGSEVCRKYNNEGCCDDCTALHVCLAFITGLSKGNFFACHSSCPLNHNCMTPRYFELLRKYGIPTNEALKDIALIVFTVNPNLNILTNPDVDDDDQNYSSKHSTSKQTILNKFIFPTIFPDCSVLWRSMHSLPPFPSLSNYTFGNVNNSNSVRGFGTKRMSSASNLSYSKKSAICGAVLKDIQNISNSGAKVASAICTSGPQNVLKSDSSQSVWSDHLIGDVPIPEICYYAVLNKCRYESKGCKRLHAKLHFHWQVSEEGKKWFNLIPRQVNCMEDAYCNPYKVGVALPPFDPKCLTDSERGLFKIMGSDLWYCDFDSMDVTNSSGTKQLYIRRLCTERIEGVKVKSSEYMWYFQNESDEWVNYGKVNVVGNISLSRGLSSEQIEAIYLKNPCGNITFSNLKCNYKLKFQEMVQENQTTGETQLVLRRPKHSKDVFTQLAFSDLDKGKETAFTMKHGKLVPLLSTSTEFQAVTYLLNNHSTFTYEIRKIERIENPSIWLPFQYKIQQMTATYGSLAAVDVRCLFHGTTPESVASICNENFDWRLHGTKNGNCYGHGTYFATNAQFSCSYAKPDRMGNRYIFLSFVAVGSKILGHPFMAKPPLNHVTSLPYDSSVNNVSLPTTVVKYDSEEYFPRYLVTFCECMV